MPISRNKHPTSILMCSTPTNVMKWCWTMYSNLTFDRQKSLWEPKSEASPRPAWDRPVAGRQKNWPIPAARIGRKKPFANRIRELKLVRRARQRAGRSRKIFFVFLTIFSFFNWKNRQILKISFFEEFKFWSFFWKFSKNADLEK